MPWYKLTIIILEVLASLALIVVISLQSGKEAGLGAISGKNDSYLSKSKFGNFDKGLSAATKWLALAWVLLTLSLSMIP
ncbi:MAG: preprotein translocase subunit SecG [Oscillospiraceae bacterium]|nr:preprotein translocase subunit SecG [Oscillospiraceae bacterium]